VSRILIFAVTLHLSPLQMKPDKYITAYVHFLYKAKFTFLGGSHNVNVNQ
jgi:hypothetical protein